MAKFRIMQTTMYDSPGTLVFCCQKSGEIPTVSPPTGAPNRGEIGSSNFWHIWNGWSSQAL